MSKRKSNITDTTVTFLHVSTLAQEYKLEKVPKKAKEYPNVHCYVRISNGGNEFSFKLKKRTLLIYYSIIDDICLADRV